MNTPIIIILIVVIVTVSSTSVVGIKDLDKLALLRALWEKSKPAIFYAMQGIDPPEFDEKEAAFSDFSW